MPTDRHLEVIEITDFSPGLWTAGGTLNMPSQGWQEMQGCRPEPGGGIRAAMEPTTWNLTGITNLATSTVLALISFGQQGAGGNDYRYIFLKETSGGDIQVWAHNGTSWSNIATHDYSAGSAGPYVQLDTFTKSTGVNYLLYTIWQNGTNTTVEGLWEINRSTDVETKVDTVIPTAMCVMDDRVALIEGSTVYFSTSGTTTMDHTNRFIDVNLSRWEPLIKAAVWISPSDLLLAADTWALVQGDIAVSPVVRSMNRSHRPSFLQNLDLTDLGIPFIEGGVGVMVTGDGNSFELVSGQLNGAAISIGDISQVGNFLLAPDGFCFDVRTKSWFTLPDLVAGNSVQYCNHRDEEIIAATETTNPTIYVYDPDEDTREDSYSIKTAPIRASDGRRVKIRQVQIPHISYNVGDTIAVTVNGTTRTHTVATVGKDTAVFLFREEGEILDVRVVSTANSASTEAPTIEALRIYKAPAHRSL